MSVKMDEGHWDRALCLLDRGPKTASHGVGSPIVIPEDKEEQSKSTHDGVITRFSMTGYRQSLFGY